MGLLDLFKKANKPSGINNPITLQPRKKLPVYSPPRGEFTPEDYNRMRAFEIEWLECYYDFNSLEGVAAIPVRKDIPRPPTGDSATGEVYYYLKFKAGKYEDAGQTELAIACFKKSIELMRLKFGNLHGREESYSFVRLLARNGFIAEATKVKKYADLYYGPDPRYEFEPQKKQLDDAMIVREHQKWLDQCTVNWLQEAFPDIAPKNVTGFRRMCTQNTKKYQLLKQRAAERGKTI